MPFHFFRPFGSLDWLLKKLPQTRWGMIGCVGTEERSLTAFVASKPLLDLNRSRFLRLADPMPVDQKAVEVAWSARIGAAKLDEKLIVDHGLMARSQDIIEASGLALTSNSLIIDISVLPKRIFFLLLKLAISSTRVKDLVVTYTQPAEYPSDPIATNPLAWRFLPGFGDGTLDKAEEKSVVLGVGFVPMGLTEVLGTAADLRVLMPFPPAGSGYTRNMMLLRQISNVFGGMPEPIRVGAINTPEAFDILKDIGQNGSRHMLLLPYGPKPISLAMCLYACAASKKELGTASVIYSQPQTYALNYSMGVRDDSGKPAISAYLIKVDGKFLFELP